MRCEVCGRRILGKPFKATIEGAKMIVCGKCARLGTVYLEATPLSTPRRRIVSHSTPKFSMKTQSHQVIEDLELKENYGLQIRRAREKRMLSHEDLGRKIGEKVSVLRKIETGKMSPNHQLAEKLEHELGIRLLVPPSEPKISPSGLPRPPEITLEKIAHLKKRKRKQ